MKKNSTCKFFCFIGSGNFFNSSALKKTFLSLKIVTRNENVSKYKL